MPYHHLDVYKRAYALALEVHKLTLGFSRIEQYELASQLRRSSKSIVANIVEGMARQSSNAEVKNFIRMAIGSCDETRTWLNFAIDLGYLKQSKKEDLEKRYCEIGRMLQGIIKKYSA